MGYTAEVVFLFQVIENYKSAFLEKLLFAFLHETRDRKV